MHLCQLRCATYFSESPNFKLSLMYNPEALANCSVQNHSFIQPTSLKSMIAIRRSVALLSLVLLLLLGAPEATEAASLKAAVPRLHNSEYPVSITTPEKALLFVNAQNLVNTWNNIITKAKTGDEQRQIMMESGVFADGVDLTFEFENQTLHLNGLDSPEAKTFYNSFVNTLKKNRYNVAHNVEALEFGEDSLRFNFKHDIFFDNQLSVVGEDQVVMEKVGDRYQIVSADINITYFDAANGY